MVSPHSQKLIANPFPGLRPYEESDSELFFGREDQVHDVLGRLRNLRFLAVLGNSGCGKSSLVRAGLLPVLRDGFMADRPDSWRIALMRPGNKPLTNLAQALNQPDVLGTEAPGNDLDTSLMLSALNRSDFGLVDVLGQAETPIDTKFLVVVDQFEELFRFRDFSSKSDAFDEAHRFVQLLLTAAGQHDSPIYVILTMRSEFLGDCSPFCGLPEAINDGLYLVPRLSREQLRDAIEQPIKSFGGKISNRLVNRMLNDLGEEQDQLPVLQHALMRLWSLGQEDMNGDPPNIDLELYESQRIGGMEQALSRHVEEILREQLDDKQKRLAEILFRSLTTVAENGEFVRDPKRLDEIALLANVQVEEVAAVIEHFRGEGKSFLMPPAPEALTADKKIDISHESLIRQWEQLRQWTRDELPARRIRKMLAEEAALWNAQERQSQQAQEFLLTGQRLEKSLEWRTTHFEELNHQCMALECEFLTQSEALRDAELRRREEQKQLQIRQQRFKAKLLGFGALAALIVAALMYLSWRKADFERSRANWISRSANLERAWRKWQNFDPISAWGYLELANEQQKSDWGCNFTADAFTGPAKSFPMKESITAISWSAVGKRLAVGMAGGLYAFNEDDLDEGGRLPVKYMLPESSSKGVRCLTWLEIGNRQPPLLVCGDNEGNVTIWRNSNNNAPEVLDNGDPANDTKNIAQSDRSDGKVKVVNCVAASPTGNRIVAGYGDGRVIAWDLEIQNTNSPKFTPRIIGSHEKNRKSGEVGVTAIAFHPDGRHVISTGKDSDFHLWDTVEKAENAGLILEVSSDAIASTFAINPVVENRQLATAGDDGMIRIWSLPIIDDAVRRESLKEQKPTVQIELKGHAGDVRCLAFAPSGRELVSTGDDGTIRVWDVSPAHANSDLQKRPQVLMRHKDQVYGLAVWNNNGGRLRIASGGFDQSLRVGDLVPASEPEFDRINSHQYLYKSIAYSSDGQWVIKGPLGGGVPILMPGPQTRGIENQDSSEPTSASGGREKDILSVAIGGRQNEVVASGDRTGKVVLWERKVNQLKQIATLECNEAANSVVVDPHGKFLLCGLANGEMIAWDISTPSSPKNFKDKLLPLKKPAYRNNKFGTNLDETSAIYSMAFNTDGNELVTGHRDGAIWLWKHHRARLSNPRYVGRYNPKVPAYSLAFSKLGDCIVSASLGGQIYIWNKPDTRLFDPNRDLGVIYDDLRIQPLIEFPGQQHKSIGVAFLPASASEQGEGVLHSITPGGITHDVVEQFDGESRRQTK